MREGDYGPEGLLDWLVSGLVWLFVGPFMAIATFFRRMFAVTCAIAVISAIYYSAKIMPNGLTRHCLVLLLTLFAIATPARAEIVLEEWHLETKTDDFTDAKKYFAKYHDSGGSIYISCAESGYQTALVSGGGGGFVGVSIIFYRRASDLSFFSPLLFENIVDFIRERRKSMYSLFMVRYRIDKEQQVMSKNWRIFLDDSFYSSSPFYKKSLQVTPSLYEAGMEFANAVAQGREKLLFEITGPDTSRERRTFPLHGAGAVVGEVLAHCE